MNSIAGKSTGIALLMAAALLAALFAMGVFSPTAVDAGVKGTPTPTAELSDVKPDATNVTLTVTFEINDDIDGAPANDDVEVHIPATLALTTSLDEDNISVTQNGQDVGSVTLTAANGDILIGQPETGSGNGVVRRDVPITLTVTGLTLAGTAARDGTTQIGIDQGTGAADLPDAETDATREQDVQLAIYNVDNALTDLSAELSDDLIGAEDVTLTLEFTTAEGQADAVTIKLPPEYNVDTGGTPETAITYTVAVNDGTVAEFTPTTADDATGDTFVVPAANVTADADHTITIGTVRADPGTNPATAGFTNPDEADTFEVSFTQGVVPAQTTSFSVREPKYDATESTVPGSGQRLELRAMIDVDERDAITVKFAKFGVPSSIDTDDVEITDSEGVTGNPSSVSVSGTTVTLYFADLNGTGADNMGGDSLSEDNVSIITFLKRAGITLPTSSNTFPIEVSSTNTDADDQPVENSVTTERTVTVDPEDGKRGTEVTITGKGFSGPRARVMITDEDDVTRTINNNVAISDGTFTLTVDTAAKDGEGNSYFGSEVTEINASDNDDMSAETSAEYDMTPSFTFTPETPVQSTSMTIKLVDTAGEPENVRFTGPISVTGLEDVSAENDAAAQTMWKFTVPANVSSGENKLSMTVGDDDLSATVDIGTNDLTISPTTVVPRQEISIDGGGFTAGGNIPANSTDIGGVDNTVHSEQLVNNNGDISFNVRVPLGLAPGSRKVEVRGDGGRVGTATITIAEPALTLDPPESLIGSTVKVTGTGFPANDLVLIKYAGNTVETAATTATGTFEEEILVPSGTSIGPGGEYTVSAESQIGVAGAIEAVTAGADHSLPEAEISLSASSATAGSTIDISGSNFKGFLQVYRVDIAGQNVTPVPAPTTDRWGSFSINNVRVPQLTPGRYAVKVTVEDEDGDSATEFLQVVTAVASRAPADVFADLVANGTLERVWYLDAATQDWSFYDPDPEFADFNTLMEVTSGQIVTLIMNANDTFEGKALYTGTNQIALD